MDQGEIKSVVTGLGVVVLRGEIEYGFYWIGGWELGYPRLGVFGK